MAGSVMHLKDGKKLAVPGTNSQADLAVNTTGVDGHASMPYGWPWQHAVWMAMAACRMDGSVGMLYVRWDADCKHSNDGTTVPESDNGTCELNPILVLVS